MPDLTEQQDGDTCVMTGPKACKLQSALTIPVTYQAPGWIIATQFTQIVLHIATHVAYVLSTLPNAAPTGKQ
jgi:hypothetical protein